MKETPARRQLRADFCQTISMPNTIYWMLVSSDQMPSEATGVLSASEFEKSSTFRFPKRRNEWLLGRWAAKSLVHSIPTYQHYSLDQIAIFNTPEGAPYIQLPGEVTLADCLSISHSDRFSLCALAAGPDLRVGADLEKIESRTEMFIQDYFTPPERQLVDMYPAEARALVATLIWSAKESMLKALGVGLHWDTRQVEIREIGELIPGEASHGGWQKMQAGDLQQGNRHWAAWWQRREQFILTLAGFADTQSKIQSVYLVEKKLRE